MIEPIRPVTLSASGDLEQEQKSLEQYLLEWLDQEFLPEVGNRELAQQAARVYWRQRLEGEDDVGALVMAVLLEMQAYDFSGSFHDEFSVANAVGELLLSRFPCCPPS